jgi:PAS domain S-box-containing protein
MKSRNLTTNRSLFLKIIFVMLIVGFVFAYYSSNFIKEFATDNLAQEDAKKTSDLAFEVLYTKMQEGWNKDDLNQIIQRLNKMKAGLSIKTYRSTLVEELYGEVKSEQKDKDKYIQKALQGEAIFFNDKTTVRYINPIFVKQECIQCHPNTKVGDVNGVIDMTFPVNDIKIPLEQIVNYFLLFTIIAIIATFFIFQVLINKIFIKPISSFVSSIKELTNTKNYNKIVSTNSKTYEMSILEDSFNELLAKVNFTIEQLNTKNKMLEEYKKAIDKSTIVSKADLRGYITYVNDEFCEISGYTQEELIGQNHNIVRSNNMPKEAFEDLWQTIKNKQIWKGVVENKAKNGESYFVKATVIPILDEHDEIIEYIGIRQDITDLKKFQQEEMKNSVNAALNIQYSTMLEDIPLSAVIVDNDSLIKYSNQIFNNEFAYLNGKKIALDEFFITKEGYISDNDLIFDWKEIVIDMQESCSNKVLVNMYGQDKEYYIFIKQIDDDFLILFVKTEDI